MVQVSKLNGGCLTVIEYRAEKPIELLAGSGLDGELDEPKRDADQSQCAIPFVVRHRVGPTETTANAPSIGYRRFDGDFSAKSRLGCLRRKTGSLWTTEQSIRRAGIAPDGHTH